MIKKGRNTYPAFLKIWNLERDIKYFSLTNRTSVYIIISVDAMR